MQNMTHINRSWREQAKAVIATNENGMQTEYGSVWKAAIAMMDCNGCQHETAKKEIRKAIKTGVPRYGMTWKFKDQ